VREEEIKNFNKVLNEALDAIPIDDVARLAKLREFGSGDVLNRRNVEVPWVVNASKNFETLKNEVHKLAMSAIEEEKPMWETVESELQKIKIADLGYDHPLYFVRQEKNKRTEKLPKSFGSAKYSTFLDDPEKLKKITNEMLLVLRRVWESPKWKAYIETEAVVNERSYVCEVISPLNIIVSDLPDNTDIWGIWAEQASSASAQRKGSYKSARQPNFMVIAQINNKEIEVGYLETGRPNSSSDKQLQDHKKLNRLAKDAIDTTTNSKKDRVFRGLAVKKMLAIFTINVAGDLLEIRCMCKEGGLYKSCLLEDAKIPLHIPSKIDDVYQFIHALLTFRTAIACTLRNILHTTDDSAKMMSMTNVSDITTSSQTSIVTVNSLPRSTSTSSSHVPKKRKSMHFKQSAKLDSQTTIASLRELNSRLSVEITEFRK
ncbi:16455_t:CDS:2, partial [Gigaspora rosea]